MKCSHCKKQVWFWQDALKTVRFSRFYGVVHVKCLEAWYMQAGTKTEENNNGKR